jgi:Zn-dependent protease/predicted transcriptional regulator
MMQASIKLGRIGGIPIGLHGSWFLIFGLVTWSLATGYFPSEYPDLSTSADWLLALVTSLLFFTSVLLHELGHAYVALRNGIPVRSITLFIFGGVAQLEQEARSPGIEFRVAIAGPLVSLVLAMFFEVLWLLDQSVALLAAPSIWLARINLMLALFNLVPGYPLDGGRILRAVVWRLTGNAHRATQIAASTGQLVAFGFIGWGILTLLTGTFFDGLWLVFIGWFLQNAAAVSYAQSSLRRSLDDVKVAQVMSQDYPQISGVLPLKRAVEEQALKGGQRYFLVGENGQMEGLLTLRDIARVPQNDWHRITALEIMVPWERVVQVEPEADLLAALKMMDDAKVGQVPVVEQGAVVGILSRDHVIHHVRVRSELNI